MSQQLISRSPDLLKLRNEGYNLDICYGYLVVADIPYIAGDRRVQKGILVMELMLAGDVTARPGTHVAHFAGDHPCNADGSLLAQIQHSSGEQTLGGVLVKHSFSAKPFPSRAYHDYYEKVVIYVNHISNPAKSIDPSVTAQTFKVVDHEDEESPFLYLDTASSRAGMETISQKLSPLKVAVVGVGGTGSYVVDLLAKSSVKEIHLYDPDTFFQHNAFRSPGAASKEDLNRQLSKVEMLAETYSKMRRGIVDHAFAVDADNVQELGQFDFVFLCIDSGFARRIVIDYLTTSGVPFCDVGMGVIITDGYIGGQLRVTTVTKEKYDHVSRNIPLSDATAENEYNQNIQIVELNAFNAALAVIKFKKHFGFYRDLERDHNSLFVIDNNLLSSDECHP